MKVFLDERHCKYNLLPFTATRHTADIRIGILTIREKWELLIGETVCTLIEDKTHNHIDINANIIPTKENFETILRGRSVVEQDYIHAINHPWHIFQLNDWALRKDFELLTGNRKSAVLNASNQCVNPGQVFIEEGAQVDFSILNASSGPVYIGKEAKIYEGSIVRGPFAACEGSVVKMGAKIYGATTLGPYSIGGGEIKNSVMFGYSNKAHDGYLGDSVIGEWCNLGAGTCNSNLKNTAGEVKYVGEKGEFASAGNKGGLLMGDYSRAAINTSFNTGSTVGVCCNIFGNDRPGRYIRNFSWGDERYILEKAIKDIDNWKKLKGRSITSDEINRLEKLYHENN